MCPEPHSEKEELYQYISNLDLTTFFVATHMTPSKV